MFKIRLLSQAAAILAVSCGALFCAQAVSAAPMAPNDTRVEGPNRLSPQSMSISRSSLQSSAVLGCAAGAPGFEVQVDKGAFDPNAFDVGRIKLVSADGQELQGNASARAQGRANDYVGRRTNLVGLQAIATELQCLMRSSGSLLSAVRVPPQTISKSSADIEFVVTLGNVTDVTFHYKGARYTRDGLRTMLSAKEVGVSGNERRALRAVAGRFDELLDKAYDDDKALQRAILLASRIPGVSIKATLKRAEDRGPGAVSMVIDVFDIDVYQGDLTVMNYSPEELGEWGALLRLTAHSQFFSGDRLSVSGFAAEGFDPQNVVRVNYGVPVADSDAVLTAYGSYGSSEPKGVLSQISLETESVVLGASVAYPIKLGRVFQVDAYAGFEKVDQTLDVVGSSISEDSLSIGYAGLKGLFSNGPIFSDYSLELRHGMNVLGASELGDTNVSRIGANPEAFVTRANVNTTFTMGRRFSSEVRFSGQYSPDPLLAYEEYAVGNFTIGRGYEPGQLSGDSATAVALNILAGPFSLGSSLGDSSLTPFVFHDFVTVWNEDRFSEEKRQVKSYGVGVRFDVSDFITGEVAYANAPDKVFEFSPSAPGKSVLLRASLKF